MKIILITHKNVIAIFTLKNHGANCAWRMNNYVSASRL